MVENLPQPKVSPVSFRSRLVIASVTIAALAFGGLVAGSTATAAAPAALPGWLHTSGSDIKTASNQTFVIKSVSWAGMDRAGCTPLGLTQVSLDAALANIAGLGFNTVNLPYTNECLASTGAVTVNATLNPRLYGKTMLQVLDSVVARAALYNLNVVLVRDRVSATTTTKVWYTTRYSESRWIADWKMLASRYIKAPNVIGFDLTSTPGTRSCWGCDSKKRDWRAAATRAGNAILAVNKNLLIIVAGVDSSSKGFTSSNGGGLEGVADKPVKLTTKHRVVYSPHEYSPTINPQKIYKYGKWPLTVQKAWTAHWGYLATKKIAPVMLGQFGSGVNAPKDKTWLKTIVAYAKKKNLSFAFTEFIATSKKTGGVVASDASTRAVRALYLEPLIGLATTVPVVVDAPTPTTVPTVEPSGNTASLNIISDWNDGWYGEFTVTSVKGLARWAITFPEPNATAIATSWGMECAILQPGFITCTGAGTSTGSIKAGESVTVGLQVVSPIAPPSDVGIVVGS